MNNNEKLIKEALHAYHGVEDRGQSWAWSAESVESMRAALAVFAKAHTPTDAPTQTSPELEPAGDTPSRVVPTDDEREALAQVVSDAFSGYLGAEPDEGDQHVADLILAAGFRRSEPQGEPSDAQVQALKVLEEAEPLAEVFGNSTAFGRAVIALRRLVDEGAALRAAGGVR